jgi:FkbM family methyltransferase
MGFRTSILFYILTRALKPGLICDIGSLDGTNSLLFRRFSPDSRIIAFEANPYNAKAIMNNSSLIANNISLESYAVSNRDGEAKFYLEKLGGVNFRNGISSLRERLGDGAEREKVVVKTVRLDNYIKSRNINVEKIALWIDVEGFGYEVLEGISGIKDNVCVIRIEIETKTFWKGQKLKPEMVILLESMGFKFLGRDMPEEQHNLVYINKKLFECSPFKFRLIKLLAHLFSYLKSVFDLLKIKNEN